MSIEIILAIVIVIVILIIIYKRYYSIPVAPTISRNGYFINQKHLGAIFPQTGTSMLLVMMNNRFVIATLDKKTCTYVPKVFPDFENRIIIVPKLGKQRGSSTNSGVHLYACKTIDDPIDANDALILHAVVDQDIGLPIIKLAPFTESENTKWKFIPTIASPIDRLRKQFKSAPDSILANINIPDQLPQWISNDPEISAAYKSGSFSGSLKNVKYPGLTYPDKIARMKRWGTVGIVIARDGNGSGNSNAETDLQILLIPTLSENQFRAFSLQGAISNKETGYLENYSQLVANNGATHELTKKYSDDDSARWAIVLAK